MNTGFYTGKSDNELVAMYTETADQSAFEELLKRTEGLRTSLAKSYLNIPGSELEDLLQEGMMEMIGAVKHFDITKKAAFTTFLYSAIQRRYNTLYKREMCEGRNPKGFVDSYERINDTEFDGEENGSRGRIDFSSDCAGFDAVEVQDAVDRAGLSEREYVAINMTMGGYTKPDVARLYGINTSSVHTYINRAAKKLYPCGCLA